LWGGLSPGGAESGLPGVNEPAPARDSHAEDLALARRAAARDEAAWRTIYERTRRRLFALLVYQVGDREEALELLQEVYLHAFQGLARYRGEGPLEAWFAIMAIRRARDWKRKVVRRRRHGPDDEEIARDLDAAGPKGPDPSAHPLRRVLDRALSVLPERQRAAFLLREVEDLSFREVAEALGVNEATARVHHLRARRALRELLKDTPGAAGFAGETEEEP
jgi:RNA polymerase sigma-70 factor (ECF subfamily)